MQNWIVACIVVLAMIYLVKRFTKSLKSGKTPDCGCTDGCTSCQTSSSCDIIPNHNDN